MCPNCDQIVLGDPYKNKTKRMGNRMATGTVKDVDSIITGSLEQIQAGYTFLEMVYAYFEVMLCHTVR